MIKKYKDFIKEKFDISQNDPAEVAADKTSFNNSENYVSEFLAKKSIIDTIYSTYVDDKDLISKLYAQKLIPQNTSDRTKIQFTNPLVGLYAQSAEKSRELKSAENDLKTQTDTLQQRITAMSTDHDNVDSLKNDVDYTKSKISDINVKIQKLKTEIQTLQKSTSDKLKQMKTDLLNNKNRIDYSNKK